MYFNGLYKFCAGNVKRTSTITTRSLVWVPWIRKKILQEDRNACSGSAAPKMKRISTLDLLWGFIPYARVGDTGK
jgi:DICT domain-containing protein